MGTVLGTGARVSNVTLKLMENKVMMKKSKEGHFIEAQSSVHQRSSIQSHVLKNDLNEPNYGKSLILLLRPRTNFDGILLVHWIAETSGTLEIRSLLANMFWSGACCIEEATVFQTTEAMEEVALALALIADPRRDDQKAKGLEAGGEDDGMMTSQGTLMAESKFWYIYGREYYS